MLHHCSQEYNNLGDILPELIVKEYSVVDGWIGVGSVSFSGEEQPIIVIAENRVYITLCISKVIKLSWKIM